MNLLKNKKHTEIRKETAPLKMKRGQKKLFALYAVMVLSICIGATCVYAAGDPLTVVNNLSTFIFSLIRAGALYHQLSHAAKAELQGQDLHHISRGL